MRKIEEEMVQALKDKCGYKGTNTIVSEPTPCERGTYQNVYLFENPIARIYSYEDGSLDNVMFSMCGWGSSTTRHRLNAIFEYLCNLRPFHQKKEIQYFGNFELEERLSYYIYSEAFALPELSLGLIPSPSFTYAERDIEQVRKKAS